MYYFEPVNLLHWNLFEKINGIGHIERFQAVKSMKKGDLLFIHVGSQVSTIQSGVYAIGEIIREPYILKDCPEDYCNNKNTVDVEIKKINYDTPLINMEQSKRIFTQFRSVHGLNEESAKKLLQYIKNEEWFSDFDDENDSLENEIIVGTAEGKRITYYGTKYERDSRNRQAAILIHGKVCMVCGFDFEETYGHLGKDFIEVHHVKPLFDLKEEVVINPETDLVCLCSNCHRMLHRKKSRVLKVNELKEIIYPNNE